MRRFVHVLCGLLVVLGTACDSEPSALQVLLSPAEPSTADNLLASVQTDDGSAAPGTFQFSWFQDGVERSDLENLSLLPAVQTLRGQVWQVVAIAVQGDDETVTLQSNSAIIHNSPPAISLVTIIPEAPDSSTVLSAEVAGWEDLDADEPIYSYSWSVDGVQVGLDAVSLEAEHFARGQQVMVEVTPSDGEASGAPVSSEAVVIGNSAPSCPRMAVLPIPPIAGLDDLLCSVREDSIDADADPIDYSVEWIVDSTAYPDGDPAAGWIGPATNELDDDTVPAADGQAEQAWTCTLSASDGTATAAAQREVALSELDQTVSDFSLIDANLNSSTSGEPVSPRDYLCKVSGWYFGHAT